MISQLKVTRYRCFDELAVHGLGRVNLFVGKNNAGKTTLLEALELVSLGTPAALFHGPRRRGEFQLPALSNGEGDRRIVSVSHLFNDHWDQTGNWFRIEAAGAQTMFAECRLTEAAIPGQPTGEHDDLLLATPALKFSSHLFERSIIVPLPSEAQRPPVARFSENRPQASFLSAQQSETTGLASLWDTIALTPAESGVVQALRIIEPRLERIAFLGDPYSPGRGVFVNLAAPEGWKLSEERLHRLPIGSMGDGMHRLLALALHLYEAREGGVVLVDEIDSGLHFSVMTEMWKLVGEVARRQDLQIFATTHSLDCVNAFSTVFGERSDVEAVLHRIDKGKAVTVAYPPREVRLATEHDVEMR